MDDSPPKIVVVEVGFGTFESQLRQSPRGAFFIQFFFLACVFGPPSKPLMDPLLQSFLTQQSIFWPKILISSPAPQNSESDIFPVFTANFKRNLRADFFVY